VDQAIVEGDLLAAGVLTAGVLVLQASVISGKRTLFAFPDNSFQTYAWYSFAARHGTIWDPYQFGGHSFVGELQTALFYPLNQLLFLVSGAGITGRALTAFLIAHMVMAAVFTYAFLRVLGIARPGALTGGLAFALGGYMVHRLPSQANIFVAATWVPLVFCLFHLALTRALWIALPAGAALGLSLLGGHFQPAAHAIIGIAAYGAWFAAFAPDRRRVAARAAAAFGLTLAIGGSLAAVQLLPSLEYQENALRFVGGERPVPADEKLPYSVVGHSHLVEPGDVEAFISPSLAAVDDGHPYIGILTLLLAAVGLLRAPRRWAVFWGLLALLSLLYAMGHHTPVHRAGYELIPLLDRIREPARALFLTHLALAVLAGYGAAALVGAARAARAPAVAKAALATAGAAGFAVAFVAAVDGDPLGGPGEGRRLALALALAGAAIVAAGLLGWLRPVAVGALCAAGLGVDLAPAGQAILGETANYDGSTNFEPHQYYRPAGAVDFLRSRPEPFRVTNPQRLIPKNAGDVHGIEMLEGHGATITSEFNEIATRGGAPPSRLQDLLNVRYAVTGGPVEGWPEVFASGAARVYENPSAMPRAWMAERWEVVPRWQDAIGRALEEDFPYRRAAVLDASPRVPAPGPARAGTVRIVERAPGELELESRTPAGGVLVLGELYYPGWKARVDGAERRVMRADGVLRAVEVPAGVHRVTMTYRPTRWTLALVLTWGAAAAILVSCLLAVVRRRRAA
jgi:hypothetical protein